VSGYSNLKNCKAKYQTIDTHSDIKDRQIVGLFYYNMTLYHKIKKGT